MNDKLFDSPVYVKDGSLVVQQIQSIEDALDFLEEWPLDKRGMEHFMPLMTHGCRRLRRRMRSWDGLDRRAFWRMFRLLRSG